MVASLLGLAVLLFVGQSLCLKLLSRQYIKSWGDSLAVNTAMYAVVTLIFLPAWRGLAAVSPTTVGLAVAFGITFIVTIVAYAKAMSLGPLGYTALFFSGGLLVPVVTGSLLWQEPVKTIQVAGFILLLVSFVLANQANDNRKSTGIAWFLFSLLTFFANGSLGALLKSHQMLLPGQEIAEFMLIAFAVALVLSLTMLGWDLRRHPRTPSRHMLTWWVLCIALGAATAFGNQLILTLSGQVLSIILFPVVNGGVLMLTALASTVIFRETFSRRGLVGFAFGVVALIILSL